MPLAIKTYLGEVFEDVSWEGLVKQLRLTNFSQPENKAELMERVAWRIKQWKGEAIQFGSYEDFIRELARVRFLQIVTDEPKP